MLRNAQVCEQLGVSRWTLHRISTQRLPYIVTEGGHRRYRQDDVDLYKTLPPLPRKRRESRACLAEV